MARRPRSKTSIVVWCPKRRVDTKFDVICFDEGHVIIQHSNGKISLHADGQCYAGVSVGTRNYHNIMAQGALPEKLRVEWVADHNEFWWAFCTISYDLLASSFWSSESEARKRADLFITTSDECALLFYIVANDVDARDLLIVGEPMAPRIVASTSGRRLSGEMTWTEIERRVSCETTVNEAKKLVVLPVRNHRIERPPPVRVYDEGAESSVCHAISFQYSDGPRRGGLIVRPIKRTEPGPRTPIGVKPVFFRTDWTD